MSCSPGATSTSNVSSSDSTSDRVRKRLNNLRKHHMESEALYDHAQPARDASIKEETHLLLKSNQAPNGTKATKSQKSRTPKSRAGPNMSMTSPSVVAGGPSSSIGQPPTQQPQQQQQSIMHRHMQPNFHHQQPHQLLQHQHAHQQQPPPMQHQQLPSMNDPRQIRPNSQIPQMVPSNHLHHPHANVYAPHQQTTPNMSMMQPQHRVPTMPNHQRQHPQQIHMHQQQIHHANSMQHHYQPRPSNHNNIMAMNHTTPILPNDLDLNMLHGGLECDVESIIKHEISVEGQLDFNFDLLHQLDKYTTTNISNHHYRI